MSEQNGPEVTCLLAISHPSLIPDAARAVEHFLNQTYQQKSLIVVNGTDHTLIRSRIPNVTEIMASKTNRDAILWNLGLDASTGTFVRLWYTDTDYEPYVLEQQVKVASGKICSVAFECQIRLDLKRLSAYVCVASEGLACTALMPRAIVENYGWPDEQYGSAEEMYLNVRRKCQVKVIRNRTDLWPAAEIKYIKTDQEAAFLCPGRETRSGMWELPHEISEHLKHKLAQCGVEVEYEGADV